MRDLLYSALCALMITAACGGGGPPGGGNGNGDTDGGDETDGTTSNDGTDGHVPNPNNPLIAVIPGTWELIAVDLQDGRGWMELQPDDPDRLASVGPVTVDPSDPDCDDAAAPYLGPPGDACIDWGENRAPTFFILDGDTVRAHLLGKTPRDGRVLDGGRRIEYNTQPGKRKVRSSPLPQNRVRSSRTRQHETPLRRTSEGVERRIRGSVRSNNHQVHLVTTAREPDRQRGSTPHHARGTRGPAGCRRRQTSCTSASCQ